MSDESLPHKFSVFQNAMRDHTDFAADAKRGASNVLPLFGSKEAPGRSQAPAKKIRETPVDSGQSLRHDSVSKEFRGTESTLLRSKKPRDNPSRKNNMAHVEREALDQDNSNGRAPDRWSAGAAPPTQDWNGSSNDRRQGADLHMWLANTIKRDIIPRLVNEHRTAPEAGSDPRSAALRPTAQEVDDFVQLVLAQEPGPAQGLIDVLTRRGMPVETIYLDLLAPASQHLSYLWTQDLCDFTQVTLGLARLQRLMHGLSPMMSAEPEMRSNARRVLLMPACGEQQSFGLSMVAEFFHHAGWEVDCGNHPERVNASDLVASGWFDVLGLAAGSETSLESLRACVLDAQHASRNKQIIILVGGPMFVGHPERVKFVGADGCGLDGKQAPIHAERLMGSRNQAR